MMRRRRWIAGVAAGVTVLPWTLVAAQANAAGPGVAAAIPEASRDAVRAAIEAGAAQAPLTHGVVVEQKRQIVGEAYFSADDKPSGTWFPRRIDFDAATLHDMRSVTKSVVGLLVGVAEARGRLDRERPVMDWFPEHAALATTERRAIRLEHLLTMTAGFDWDETSITYGNLANSETRMGYSSDPVGFVLSRDMVAPSGSRFAYSGGATLLLAEIVERATGQPIDALAREALFAPLGIDHFEWRRHTAWGKPLPYSGLRLAPRSMARIGRLMLDRGHAGNAALVPEAWVAGLQQRRVADTGGGLGYGWQWWVGRVLRGPGAGLDWFAGLGNGGQVLMVLPALDATIAVTAGRYNTPASSRPSLAICQKVIAALTA